MIGDTGITTYLMYATNEVGATLSFVYLWVTIGNGFRYGVRYLIACATLSVAGFSIVLLTTPFWQQQTGMDIGMLLMLVLIPLYAGFLLRKMHKAVEQANEASLAKSVFLASMSHEVRTPLNGIIGLTDLLQTTTLDRRQKDMMDAVQVSAHTLSNLIEDVLDISRIEAGRMDLSSEDFDLYAQLKSLKLMMEPQAVRKGIKLIMQVAPGTPHTIHGDQKRLKQILVNLVGNAIKFTEQGRVEIVVGPDKSRTTGKEWLRFEIIDSGIGIPKDRQAHIFEPFVQSDAGITRKHGGSGLGTTISRHLVEMMDGQIGLESEPGKGSTFWFRIPLLLAKKESPRKVHNGLNVGLLVSPKLRNQISDRIIQWGGSPTIFDNAEDMAKAAKLFDAVVIDRGMLNSDPAEFVGRIKEGDSSWRSPPVLTDRIAEQQERELLHAGYTALLKGPDNPDGLFNALRMAATETGIPANVVNQVDCGKNEAKTKKLHVLVAEDNPINQKVVRGLIEHAGHEVTVVSSGEAALDVLEIEDGNISLAIVDMHMPDMSGVETVKCWRAIEHSSSKRPIARLPIIILTADARVEAERICREAGADDFLTKPVDSRLLIEKIAEWGGAGQGNQSNSEERKISREQGENRVAVLDESILERLGVIAGGKGIIKEIIDDFKDDTTKGIQEARKALMRRDYDSWRQKLHALKGGAIDIGALEMLDACRKAEQIRPYEIEQKLAVDLLASVEKARDRAYVALCEYRDEICTTWP